MEKERRTKALLLSTLVVVVATLSIAFAAMSRTLSINGIGKMDTATWDVHFENLSEASITRDAIEISKPNISLDKGTVENINVKLTKPKDKSPGYSSFKFISIFMIITIILIEIT